MEKKKIDRIYRESECLMIADKIRIRKEIRRLNKKFETIPEKKKALILNKYSEALEKIRKRNIPAIKYNEILPIISRKKDIIEKINSHQVIVISGETGSGKTTQIPKICMEAGLGTKGMIGCTQPRRIAALSVAERISEELEEPLGFHAGYKVRFNEKTSEDTIVKIMTDGILLAETLNDPWLNAYDTIIIDEAHERSLNIDFLMGFLSKLIKKRKDLKLIITSATIDTEKFSKAFNNAPIIEVSGRTFPVETIYMPPEESEDDDSDLSLTSFAADAVSMLEDEPDGDILIFMPTENDIKETMEKLKGRDNKSTILPLYSRLPSHMQKKVFARTQARKIVVATNVAETSITIPGIKYVIDTGLARIPKYMPSSRTTALPVTKISKSSADQRKGRCGRVENGVCIRLFSEEDYNNRPRFTLPEILRANLSDVLLKMTALKLGRINDFPFIDKPESKNINDGYKLLTELGAIKESKNKAGYKLTDIGKTMARLPLDPRLARILIEASNLGCLEEILIIVSGLTAVDPRERPEENKEKALFAQKKFIDPLSDFITLLNIFDCFKKESGSTLSTGSIGRFCKKYYLSFRKMKEWRDILQQMRDIIQDERLNNSDMKFSSENKNQDVSHLYEAIHRALLSGYLSNIAIKTEKNIFRGTGGKEVMIFPGSGLFKNSPDWIVAAEMVETSRLFARTNAYVKPEWISETAKDLLKITIYDPHYEKKQGRVLAFAQKSLYGLIIEADAKIAYDKINIEDASRIFIRHAIVNGEIKENLNFIELNRKLAESIKDLEERTRKRDILISPEKMEEIYLKRLEHVADIRTLKKIIRKKGDEFLVLKKEDLMNYDPESDIKEKFPDHLNIAGEKFSCRYSFSPGEKNDGVTVSVPASKASLVSQSDMDMVVPGLFPEKVMTMLKSLPKNHRTALSPLREKAEIIAEELKSEDLPLSVSLSKFISKRFNINIPANIFQKAKLPDHLKIRVELTDIKGSKIKASRDLSILKKIKVKDLPDSEYMGDVRKKIEKEDVKEFESIPNEIKIYPDRKDSPVFYPAYECSGEKVNLKLFKNLKEADSSNPSGVKRLYEYLFAKEIKNLSKSIQCQFRDQTVFMVFDKKELMEKGLVETILSSLFLKNIKDKGKFHEYAEEIKKNRTLFLTAEKTREAFFSVIGEYMDLFKFINNMKTRYSKTKLISQVLVSCEKDMKRLVPKNFHRLYSCDEMIEIPRYLKAIRIRIERGISKPAKDMEKQRTVDKLEDKLNQLLKGLDEHASDEKKKETESFFWDIEEFKISTFAQELKTKYPVSEKKLEQKFIDTAKMI